MNVKPYYGKIFTCEKCLHVYTNDVVVQQAPHLELWERNLHYKGAWLMQFPRKHIILEERLNTYGIKDVPSITATEYDN
jgi:hypothetical protein